ncbi:MAG: MATE family efflux transporter, partial [Anaerolineaceae bacterium]|nr:MATE family efflux transporter [Anaerolineaceae bacterium]
MKNILFADREFYKTLARIAIPIALQQLVTSSVNLLDVLMVGQMGEVSIAALGLSNQVFFLMTIILFGASSGMAIFSAQYWGKRDVVNIRRVLGIGLSIAISISFLFMLAVLFVPEKVLGFYTNDADVIALGSQYLQIVGLCYVPTAISYTFMSVLRSTGNVKLPTAVSVLALSMNIFLNYTLIFGNFGMPALGVRGAAIGTAVSRSVECLAMVFFAYRLKTPAAAKISELFSFDRVFFRHTLNTSLPALLNEGVWAFGITTYNSIYAHIGTEAIAAVNINSTIESMAFVVFIGSANAAAIMIGNKIGAGHEEVAYAYGKRLIALGITGAVIVGIALIFLRGPILSLYYISAQSLCYSNRRWLFFSLTLWV